MPGADIFAEAATLHGVALAPDGTRLAVLYMQRGEPHLALLGVSGGIEVEDQG